MKQKWPSHVMARAYVLYNLREGPAPYGDLIEHGVNKCGFTRDEIDAAGVHLGVTAHELQGEKHWTRPANLFAIWWGRRPKRHFERQEQGNAA
jgi:hypothetical protein